MTRSRSIPFLLLALGCSLSTSRPAFGPVPEARVGDLDVEVAEATERLAKALTDAGIPVERVAAADGYLESAWFDTASGRRASGRPLGQDVVRVRGWITPSAHGSSEMKVEAVYRPVADPSRPPRELERSVPYAHPVREMVRQAYRAVGARSVTEEPDAITLSARRAAGRRPPAARDTVPSDRATTDSAAPLAAVERQPDALQPDSLRPAPPPARQDSTPRPVERAVTPEPVRPPPTDSAAPAAPQPAAPAPAARAPVEAPRGYSVQVTATSDSAAATLAARRLGAMGIEPNVIREGTLLKVRSGAYPTPQAAQTVLARVRRAFPDAFVVR